jgi:hypothetical protein
MSEASQSAALAPVLGNQNWQMQVAMAQLNLQQDAMETVGEGVLKLIEAAASVTANPDGSLGNHFDSWA